MARTSASGTRYPFYRSLQPTTELATSESRCRSVPAIPLPPPVNERRNTDVDYTRVEVNRTVGFRKMRSVACPLASQQLAIGLSLEARRRWALSEINLFLGVI